MNSRVKAMSFDRFPAPFAEPRASRLGANRRTDTQPTTLWAIVCLALCLPTSIATANPIEATAEPPSFLVIEGEWLTPEAATDPPDAIQLLHQNSVATGTATDFVLEHAAIASPARSGNKTPRSLTVWNRFAPSALAVAPSPDGQSVQLTLRTEEGLLLDFRIESDAGPIASGFYADDETWIRLNAFELSPEGPLVFDLEYEIPSDNALHSGRLRVNAPKDEANSVFLPASEAELRDARPGGIATYWIQFGDGVAAAPLYFGEQFSEVPVLSYEEALRRVAPDRRKLESDLPDRSSRESTPEPSPDRPAPQEPAPPTSAVPSPQATAPAASFEPLQPAATPRSSANGGIAFGAGARGLQRQEEVGSPALPTTDRSRLSHSTAPPPTASFHGVTEPWNQVSQRNPSAGADSDGVSPTSSTPREERSESADLLATNRATSLTPRSSEAVESDRLGDTLIWRASSNSPKEGKARPTLATRSLEDPARSGSTTAPNNAKLRDETYGKTFSRSLDLAVDQLRNLIRRGLEWWQGVSA